MISEYPHEGTWCWAVECAGYPLPAGLAHRSRVKVLDEKPNDFHVEDENGRRWRLYLTQIDAGHTYYLDGEACFETHPKAVHYLLHCLREKAPAVHVMHDYADELEKRKERIRWELERNGFDPDAPLPPGRIPRFTGSPMKKPSPNARTPRQFRPETGEKGRVMRS